MLLQFRCNSVDNERMLVFLAQKYQARCRAGKDITACTLLSEDSTMRLNSKTAGCRFDSCPTCPNPKSLRNCPERFLLWSFLHYFLDNRRSGRCCHLALPGTFFSLWRAPEPKHAQPLEVSPSPSPHQRHRSAQVIWNRWLISSKASASRATRLYREPGTLTILPGS
jgi:hypothetical protein